jgi:hypothetical protein
MADKTCPRCNPTKRVDKYPILDQTGLPSPRVYVCWRCGEYFDEHLRPYEPKPDEKVKPSSAPVHDPKKIVRNPWTNDPANAPNLDDFDYEMSDDTKEQLIRYYLNKWRTWDRNYLIYKIAEILDTKPGIVRAIADEDKERIFFVE